MIIQIHSSNTTKFEGININNIQEVWCGNWITYYSPELSGYLHSLIYHFIELKSKGQSVWPYGVLDCNSHIYLFLKEINLSFGSGLHLALMTCWYFTHFPGRFSGLLQYQWAWSQRANSIVIHYIDQFSWIAVLLSCKFCNFC